MPFSGYAGYGLADGYPHQVEIFKGSYELGIVIDRGTDRIQSFIVSSALLADATNFDQIYLGNHPDLENFDNFQSLTKTNFVGCFEEVKWNEIDVLHKPYSQKTYPICDPPIPTHSITFMRTDSFIMLYRDKKATGFDLAFDIVLYQNFSTIIKHVQNETTFTLEIIAGRLQMTVLFSGQIVINALNPINVILDGLWHHVNSYKIGINNKIGSHSITWNFSKI